MGRSVIGIDVGGTNLRLAVVDAAGRIVQRQRVASHIIEGRAAFCQRLEAAITLMRADAAASGGEVVAIGLGIPGLIDGDGTICSSVNMRPLDGFNLAGHLARTMGMPVQCGNDANVIALGEHRFGAGRGRSSLMVITIGTGLGSGLVLNGRIWSGTGGYASEFGHVTVLPDGRLCSCGNRGCLEQYVSAGALVRTARAGCRAAGLPDVASGLDAEGVGRYARQGHGWALEAFQKIGTWLGIAVASLANTLNLEAVVVGGGVAPSFELLEPALVSEVKRRCFPAIARSLDIVQAELGDDAGLLGAAALAAGDVLDEQVCRVR